MAPPETTEAVAAFDSVRFAAAVTVVAALPQLVVAHEAPGAATVDVPVAPTAA